MMQKPRSSNRRVFLSLELLEDRTAPAVLGPFTNVPNPDANPFDASKLTPALQNALARFEQFVADAGGTATPTSGYRPREYQQHLRDIFDKYNALVAAGAKLRNGRLTATPGTTSAKYQSLINAVNTEILHHGLGYPPRVNRPDNSKHSSLPAEAVDISVAGVDSATIDHLACRAGLYRSKLGNGTREGQIHYELLPSGLDLVFVIDTTGSMSDDIDAVKAAATQIVNELTADHSRTNCPQIGIVLYKDFGDAYVSQTALPFTDNTEDVIAAINAITVGGGGDTPEAVYSGLVHAIDNLSGLGSWRGGNIAKRIILFGDAEPHDPEPNTGYTQAIVNQKALDADPVDVFSVAIGSSSAALTSFQSLAVNNRGKFFTAATAGDVVDKLLEAIEEVIATSKPPTIQQVQFKHPSGQPSSVNSIVITFNTTVNLAPEAFVLRRQGGSPISVIAHSSVVNGHTVVQLTFSGPGTVGGTLVGGPYVLRIEAAKVTVAGRLLDGNGDGAGGDDFTRRFGGTTSKPPQTPLSPEAILKLLLSALIDVQRGRDINLGSLLAEIRGLPASIAAKPTVRQAIDYLFSKLGSKVSLSKLQAKPSLLSIKLP